MVPIKYLRKPPSSKYRNKPKKIAFLFKSILIHSLVVLALNLGSSFALSLSLSTCQCIEIIKLISKTFSVIFLYFEVGSFSPDIWYHTKPILNSPWYNQYLQSGNCIPGSFRALSVAKVLHNYLKRQVNI